MSTAQKDSDASDAQEITPLLPREGPKEQKWGRSVLYRAYLCAFFVSLSFGVTQVPILYVFRIMTCDGYYEVHPLPKHGSGDRCAKREIEAGTARAVVLLGASTTIFGLMNLLVTGWTIKRLGVKTALLIQVFFPAVRLGVQNVGVMVGSSVGILIIQCSQIITIIGGPNGYVLALNSFVTDVVSHEERTGAIGRLQGCMLVGAAVGFLAGGLIGDAFNLLAPFQITLALFLLCCIYVVISFPLIPAEEDVAARQAASGIARFFGPFRIFAPQKWVLPDGRSTTQYGALTLGIGVFLAILATGYIPTLLQMYATDEFGFGTKANGWMISMYFTLRGLYLSLIFPRIISIGRKWLQPKDSARSSRTKPKSQEEEPLMQDLPTSPNEIGPIDPMDNDVEPVNPPAKVEETETFQFDLLYTRVSLITDGILTGFATFVSQGWQLYIVAAVLPVAAGTGSASKGAILQMLPSSERVVALAGITLVENIARLSTMTFFGLFFAALAEVEKIYLIFSFNAAVALIGFAVLCLSRFPPEGSRRADECSPVHQEEHRRP